MSLIAKNIETNPLNRMKDTQCQSETKVINNRNGIRNQLFHNYKKIVCKSKKYILDGIV